MGGSGRAWGVHRGPESWCGGRSCACARGLCKLLCHKTSGDCCTETLVNGAGHEATSGFCLGWEEVRKLTWRPWFIHLHKDLVLPSTSVYLTSHRTRPGVSWQPVYPHRGQRGVLPSKEDILGPVQAGAGRPLEEIESRKLAPSTVIAHMGGPSGWPECWLLPSLKGQGEGRRSRTQGRDRGNVLE